MATQIDNSNVAPISASALIKQEAGAWIVKIDQGSLTPEQIQQLQQWIQQSDFHREYLEKLAHNWDAMGSLQDLAELFPIQTSNKRPWLGRLKQAYKKAISSLQRPSIWGPALASLVLIAVLIPNLQLNTYTTDIGQQASHHLSDGTVLSLNTNSSIKLDYSSDRRVVRLLKGEAHFEVAKNPERPFMVYAGDGVVWAVGTAFNVRYVSGVSDPYVDVTVTEGTVKIFAQIAEQATPNPAASKPTQNPAKPTEQLVPAGNSVQYNGSIKVASQAPEVIEQKVAWQQGALIFAGETLEQAIQEISRYTDKKLIITDPNIRQIRVGGHYKTDDITSLLASLSQGFNIQMQIVGKDSIELSGKR